MTGTVTATFEGLTRGTVEFSTNTADGVLRDPTGNVLWAGPKKVRIVDGELSVVLPATDDTAYAETDWQWRAKVKLDGKSSSFIRWFELPDAATVDLADIAGEFPPGDPLTHPLAYADVVADIQDPESVIGQTLSASIGDTVGITRVATGTGNDRTAIHAARDAAGVDGVVFIDDALTVSGVLNATVAGQEWRFGPSGSITLANGANSDAIDVQADGVTIVGPVIAGNASNQASGAGGILVRSGVDDVTIVRPIISNTRGVGINCEGDRLTVLDGDFTDTGDASIAVTAPAASNRFSCRISGNRIRNSASGPYGIRVHGTNSGSNGVKQTIITGNDVELPATSSAGLCIEVWGVSPRSIIANNHTTGGTVGVSVSTSDDTAVTGNTAKGAYSYCYEVAQSNNVSLTGNIGDGDAVSTRIFSLSNPTISNVAMSGNTVRNWKNAASCYALHATGVAGVTITGNIFDGPTEPLYLSGCSNYNVAGNMVDGNGTTYDGINLDTCGAGSVINNTFVGVGRSGVIVYGGAMTDIKIGPNLVPSGIPQVYTGAVALGARSVVHGGYGTTAQRYSAVEAGVGGTYWDTTLGKPLYSDGTNWKKYADDTNA